MDTGRFEFVALGTSEKEAMAALAMGWNAHREQQSQPILSWEDAQEYFGKVSAEISPGECLRDWDEIKRLSSEEAFDLAHPFESREGVND